VATQNPEKTEPTDETYTFDAVLILAAAVKSCDQSLNRRCILQYLEKNHAELVGACQKYHLDKGERQNASYEIYSGCKNALLPRWSVAKGGVYEDTKWRCN
jgi:ABC-type branched-subunit amino acid transport system substrate-binding protein